MMKVYSKIIPLSEEDRKLREQFFPKRFEHYFLDIETTGLSRSNDEIIIIGVMTFQGDSLLLKQYFSEKKSDERRILSNFIAFLNPFSHIITFNGTAFDIGFLNEKLKSYHLPVLDERFFYSDLYQWVQKLSFEDLKDRKLKTLCEFFHIERVDDAGANLLRSYERYRKTKDPLILDSMLLHNFEDVHNLFYLYRAGDYLPPVFRHEFLPSAFEKKSKEEHISCFYRFKIQNDKEISIVGLVNRDGFLPNQCVDKSPAFRVRNFAHHVGNVVTLSGNRFELRLYLEHTTFQEQTLLLVNILDIKEDLEVEISAKDSVILCDNRVISANLETVIALILKRFLDFRVFHNEAENG